MQYVLETSAYCLQRRISSLQKWKNQIKEHSWSSFASHPDLEADRKTMTDFDHIEHVESRSTLFIRVVVSGLLTVCSFGVSTLTLSNVVALKYSTVQ